MSEFALDTSFEVPTIDEMYEVAQERWLRVREGIGGLVVRFSTETLEDQLPDMAVALNGEDEGNGGNGGNGNGGNGNGSNGDVVKEEKPDKTIISMKPGSTKKPPKPDDK